MTAKELLNEGKAALSEVTDEYELDAWYLFEHATGIARHEYLMDSQVAITDEKCNIFREYISKRSKHIPLQHIVGTQWFMGLEFEVNEHVLIPRQDTEVLVEESLKVIKAGDSVLDMCTGSGCIIISLAKNTSLSEAVGVDVSADALGVAKINAVRHDADVKFVQSDLFTELGSAKHDVIVSNPPYIETEEINHLMPEVREHEPMIALDGGADGLIFYRKIINESGMFLKDGGYLLFEVGHNQADEVCRLMEEAGFKDVMSIKDLCGIKRVCKGRI
ncbi:MAG: peptide chain release factor N(5)-glutamine methyltransferase [Lachnospiraceae bacterium]|nr:peptide chain release factor N(5)-glutamine methyltransferase [Lachnospiraceae bacterium]